MATLLRTLAVAMSLALVLVACGDDAEEPADTTDTTDQTEEPAEEPEDPAEEPEDPADDTAAGTTVAVGSTGVGEVLVDGEGRTLYLFEPDEQGASTCYDDCASNWPPLLAEGGAQAGEGADEALLGTSERRDGTTQVTYNDWPLYHFAGDEAAGDANGQGLNDVWWVVGPDGEPMRDGEDVGSRSPY